MAGTDDLPADEPVSPPLTNGELAKLIRRAEGRGVDIGLDKAEKDATESILTRRRADRAADEYEASQDPLLLESTRAVLLSEVAAQVAKWRITGVMEQDWVTLLWAAAKTGKTTLVINLVHALTSGEPFLGKFDVTPLAQGLRVGILNYEMNAAGFREWADLRGVDSSRVAVWNLRGMPNPLATALSRRLLAAECRARAVGFLIIDTYSRAMIGDNEDSNPAATAWFKVLGELMKAAQCPEVAITHHAGHNADRLRGASALRDNPDCLWGLTRGVEGGGGDPDTRYLDAVGRFTGKDAGLERTGLEFDPATLELRLGGTTAAEAKKSTVTGKAGATVMRNAVDAAALLEVLPVFGPGVAGSSGRKVSAAMSVEKGIKLGNSGRLEELLLILKGQVKTEPGPRGSTLHWRLEPPTAPTAPTAPE
jgi:hypothetical protein